MSSLQIVESMDDVPEAVAPTVFSREFSEYLTFDDTGLTIEELPKQTLWRVLVMPKQPKKMSAGGIALPDQLQEVEMHLNYIGQVVSMGPLAGKSEKFLNPDWGKTSSDALKEFHAMLMEGGDWAEFEKRRKPEPNVPRYLWDVKVGDWVIYGKYAGQTKTYKGVRFLTVNDDEITDVIKSPDGYRVYV